MCYNTEHIIIMFSKLMEFSFSLYEELEIPEMDYDMTLYRELLKTGTARECSSRCGTASTSTTYAVYREL